MEQLQSTHNQILIIEDDIDILLGLKELLEMKGYQVQIAENGLQALEKIKKTQVPDVILLDMKMPIMNGWQFAKDFVNKYDHQAKILVMTAAADAEERAKEISANDWVGKPFEFDELLQKIKSQTES